MAKTFGAGRSMLSEDDPQGTIELIAPAAGTTAGVGVLIGQTFGVALETKTVGQTVRVGTKGVWLMAKEAVQTDPGDTIFWNTGNNTVDKASAKAIGWCIETALAGVATCKVRLVPDTRADVTA